MSIPVVAVPVVVAELVRSGFVEGHHYGSVVALDRDGAVDWSVGSVDQPILPPELLALVCASHSGEPFHLDGVRRILASAGLDEAALQTPPDYPLEDAEWHAVVAAGGERTPIQMNCSGKHAGMLATCVVNGWDIGTYLEPTHPLQVAIRSTIEEVTGEPVAVVATDGCGAPLLSTSLVGLATAFRRLAIADDGAERRVADAIREHPAWVSGTRRDECALLTAIPGAIGKAGAEACYAVALPDGRAYALKVDDGGARARPVVMAAALHRSGVDAEPGVDGDAVRRTGDAPLLGGGRRVGEIRAVL